MDGTPGWTWSASIRPLLFLSVTVLPTNPGGQGGFPVGSGLGIPSISISLGPGFETSRCVDPDDMPARGSPERA